MLSATQASVEFIECGRAIEVHRFYFAPTPQAAWRSKWNFVFVRLGSRSGFRRRAWFAGAPSAITLIAAIRSTTATRTSQHLHRFADHLQLAPLLSGLFVVPSVELEPALNKNRPPFFQILTGDFRRASPESDIHKRHLLALFAVLQCVLPIHRNSKIRHGAPLWRITHFGITGQISKQNDFIKTGHASFLAKLLFGRDLFRRLFRLFTFWLQPLKMLAINFGIEFEFRPQFRNQLRIGIENEIYIVSRVQFAGSVGELPLIHLLHLLDLSPFFFKL